MRYILFSLFFCFSYSLTAQKHDNIWMSGSYDNFYVDFTDFPPHIYLVDNEYFMTATLTFMSDVEGIPLFYSNGCDISNTVPEQLQNGDSLVHHDYFCSSGNNAYMNLTHGAGVTLPGFLPGQYIMLSLSYGYPLPAQPCQSNRLVAHYIDMSANEGKGEVTQKEQEILTGCFQEPTANRHANGRDWWIVMGDNQQGRFFRWLLTPSGLQGPWEQIIANPTIDGAYYCGWSESSPDGERYMVNACRTGIALYDFDRCTGLLSNPVFIQRSAGWNVSATFSPDSKLLYTIDDSAKKLIQYDLFATDINASREVLLVWDGMLDPLNYQAIFAYMQQGPDGKVYIWAGGSYYMHLIDFPNRTGTACSARQRAIQLPASSAAPSLYYPRYRLGPIDGSSCDTLGIDNHPSALFRYDLEDTLSPLQVTFTDVSSYLPTAWHWDFGDATTSQDTNPVHTYALPGTYTVCLIASNAFAADTFCRQVTVGTVGVHELPVLPQARVLPNPFSQEIRVQLPALVSVAPQFVVSDLYGRQVANVTLRDFETTIALPGIPAGMYVWQLLWQGVQTQQGGVVKVE